MDKSAEGSPGKELAKAAAFVKSAAADLALAEEPAGFVAALEGEGADE